MIDLILYICTAIIGDVMRLDLIEKIIIELRRQKMTQKELAKRINIKRERLNEVLNLKKNNYSIVEKAHKYLFDEK